MLDQLIGGRYKVVAKLGEGGMGAVYEARHTETSRRVAVKVISADASRSPSSLARFETEAKAAGQLESQYIAQVLDAGRDEGTAVPFLVMEYLDGEDLSHVFARLAPIDPDLVLRMMAQACMGLEKAHAAGIVHRDIKPANLLLAAREGNELVLKVLDFGIAKLLLDGQKGPTRTGALIGSPLYMSPEQARGAGGVDHRSDLWSLGIVMYEALTGKAPHHGIDGIGDLLMAICTEEPPPLRDVAPWVDDDVAAIVARALKIDLAERFQSATEMLKAIKALLPMGIRIEGDVAAADTSRRPTARAAATADTARDQAWSGIQARSGEQVQPVQQVLTAPTVPTGPAAAPRVHEGPTMQSAQPPSGPAPIPTMASETDSTRARQMAVPSGPPVTYGSAPPSYGAGPATPQPNWYPPSGGQAPQGWMPQQQPAPAPAPASKSRVLLWFGCGVVACIMGLFMLVIVVALLDDETESESTEGKTPTHAPTSGAPGRRTK